MKRLIIITLAVVSMMVSACQTPVDPTQGPSVVVLPEGPVTLQDTQLGMYYGNINGDGIGLFSVVLSDALCYQDELGNPYLDSEGDMLVLQFRALAEGEDMFLPSGNYTVSEEGTAGTVDPAASYLRRQVGDMQAKWEIRAGEVNVTRASDGEYSISTSGLVVFKEGQTDTVEYVFNGPIVMEDYLMVAPSMLTMKDDIIDMPFADVECIYNGDLFGNGTGNFLVNFSTKGFVTPEGEVNDVAGIYITLNFFSRLYSGKTDPVLEEGKYQVSTMTSSSLFQRWTLLPGLMMDGTPFGSYMLQQTSDGEGTMEFITSGVVEVDYEDTGDDIKTPTACTLTYSFKTSGRTISGVWKGDLIVENQAATGSNESFLTTLDHDVECDMSKASHGTLALVEVLHRDNVEEEWDYDIAEAWQLWIEADPAYADGDAVVFEFVLPLGSEGDFAPELNKTYTYTMQPNLAEDEEMYEIYVSRMGRPHDEIFDPFYAEQNPGWAEGIGITSYDRCNARRGFMYSGDVRGNWYIHYEAGRYYIMDEHAPAVNGWVKVTRTGEDIYDFEWDFIDDNPGTPNRITGSIKNCKVNIRK